RLGAPARRDRGREARLGLLQQRRRRPRAGGRADVQGGGFRVKRDGPSRNDRSPFSRGVGRQHGGGPGPRLKTASWGQISERRITGSPSPAQSGEGGWGMRARRWAGEIDPS